MGWLSFDDTIKTSILMIFGIIVLFLVGVMIYFQYKISDDFSMLSNEKTFYSISNKVSNKIKLYDIQSKKFIQLAQTVKGFAELPSKGKRSLLFPFIAKYIENTKYVYAIYLGYENNSLYIVYNLDLSQKMREAQKSPSNAKWLVKKNIPNKNGRVFSYSEFLDKNFKTIFITKEITSYMPTNRPWYRDSIVTNHIIKTKPYVFTLVKEPGVTYAKKIRGKNGAVLALDITLNTLNKFLSSTNLVDGSAAFIFSQNGTVIAQVDNIFHKKIKKIQDNYSDLIIKNKNIIDLNKQVIVNINEKKYFKYTTIVKSIFSSKNYLVILSPVKTITQPYKDKLYSFLLVSILILVFIILPIIFYMLRFIENSLRSDQKSVQKYIEPNWEFDNSNIENEIIVIEFEIQEQRCG